MKLQACLLAGLGCSVLTAVADNFQEFGTEICPKGLRDPEEAAVHDTPGRCILQRAVVSRKIHEVEEVAKDQNDTFQTKYESCREQVRSGKAVLAQETDKMLRGSNGSAWVVLEVLQECLRALDDGLIGNIPGDVGDRALASVSFMVRTWAELANKTGKGAYLCALPEDHVMIGAQLRVEALGWEVKEECGPLLVGMRFKLLDSLREMFSEASVAIGCISAGLPPFATKASTLQQEPELSFSTRSNTSEAQKAKQLFHWVTQADYRLDYLEAMVPGSRAALQRYFGQVFLLIQLSDSDFLERLSAFKESISASLIGQHHSNFAKHPMRAGGPATRGYETCRGWRPDFWNGRRRCSQREAHRLAFKHDKCCKRDSDSDALKCDSDSEKYLDAMFESPYVMDGCSSPVPVAFKEIVTPVCFSHDACYHCNHAEGGQGWCDDEFGKKLEDECWRRLPWGVSHACQGQALIMHAAVVAAGDMHGSKPKWWCGNGCARDVYRFGNTHIEQIKRWF